MARTDTYYDLDAALADLDAEPIRVKVKGRKFDFPSTISTHLVLRLAKIAEAGDVESRDVDTLMDFWRHLFGQENFRVLVDELNLSLRELRVLQDHLLSQYGVTDDATDDQEASTEVNPQ